MRFRPRRLLLPINLSALVISIVLLSVVVAAGSPVGIAGVALGILFGVGYASFSSQGEVDTRWKTLVRMSREVTPPEVTEPKRAILLSLDPQDQHCLLAQRSSAGTWEVQRFEKKDVGAWRRARLATLTVGDLRGQVNEYTRLVAPLPYSDAVLRHVSELGAKRSASSASR